MPISDQIFKEFCSELSHLIPPRSSTEWVTTSSGRDADLSFLMKESKFSHIKVGNIVDTETHMTRILLPVAGCVRKSNDSHSAIRIAYRSSLRSSSVREPRYPPLKIFFFVC